MTAHFFERLRLYYLSVAEVLRGEAKVASVFANTTDIGTSRERVYQEFLRQHAPSKCNVFLGGFLFGAEGDESAQLDVIVSADTVPRFDFHNQGGAGKSFSPVDGTLLVASIKSKLDKKQLEDALRGFASIPSNASLEGRVAFGISIKEYDDWPYKVIYASDGVEMETLVGHVAAFYAQNSGIPMGRRPNVIHVAGKYMILRFVPGLDAWNSDTKTVEPGAVGTFRGFTKDPDLQAIVIVLNHLQERALASTHILFSYHDLSNKVLGSS